MTGFLGKLDFYFENLYSTIKKNENLPLAMWMNLQGITLSEISQTSKGSTYKVKVKSLSLV